MKKIGTILIATLAKIQSFLFRVFKLGGDTGQKQKNIALLTVPCIRNGCRGNVQFKLERNDLRGKDVFIIFMGKIDKMKRCSTCGYEIFLRECDIFIDADKPVIKL